MEAVSGVIPHDVAPHHQAVAVGIDAVVEMRVLAVVLDQAVFYDRALGRRGSVKLTLFGFVFPESGA